MILSGVLLWGFWSSTPAGGVLLGLNAMYIHNVSFVGIVIYHPKLSDAAGHNCNTRNVQVALRYCLSIVSFRL